MPAICSVPRHDMMGMAVTDAAITLCSHVLKYLLGRKVRFHDLAFFDPVIYESLRQLVLDAEKKETSADRK